MAFNSIPEYGTVAAGNTDIGGVSIAEGFNAANINNSERQLLAQLKTECALGSVVASASTVDISKIHACRISGTTPITTFTITDGTTRWLTFAAACPITYDGTKMVIQGGVSVTMAAGDMAVVEGIGVNQARVLIFRASGAPAAPVLTPAISEIGGLLPTTIAGTSTTATLTVTTGSAADSTNVQRLSLGSTSWAVTNGNAANGYQGGSTLPNSSTIHFFIMFGTSGTASFASLSATAPTLPSGYTLFRRIFSLKTTVAGALIPGTAIEDAGGAIIFYLTTQVLDINATTTTANRTLAVLSVPLGIKVQPLGRGGLTTSTSSGMIFTSPDETDVAPSAGTNSAVPGIDSAANASFNGSPIQPFLTTDTSGQIGHRGTAAVAVGWTTRGWRDFRRS